MHPEIGLEQRLLTADEYQAMGEAGILDEDERVELIDGRIIPMTATGGPHFGCVNRLTRIFVSRTPPLSARVVPPLACPPEIVIPEICTVRPELISKMRNSGVPASVLRRTVSCVAPGPLIVTSRLIVSCPREGSSVIVPVTPSLIVVQFPSAIRARRVPVPSSSASLVTRQVPAGTSLKAAPSAAAATPAVPPQVRRDPIPRGGPVYVSL